MRDSDDMSSDHGIVVFSLDFELHWGVHDVASVSDWRDRLLGARRAVPHLLDLMQEYQIDATWAVVGMLFARDREELKELCPSVRPSYRDPTLSPYDVSVGTGEEDDPFHFALSLIQRIAEAPGQEIATHTFSHYYCLEDGQKKREFDADLKSAIDASAKLGARPTSIVFPRNQINAEYVDILTQNGITSYRGVTRAWPYTAGDRKAANAVRRRFGRFVDTYVPLFGRTSFTAEDVRASREDGIYNIPASIFIRSHSPGKKAVEPLRRWRIESEIRHAAEQKKIVHLWTHPHNFGEHTSENLRLLENVFGVINECRHEYGLVSTSMDGFLRRCI